MRRPYLDNIRWITVALVLVYHVCYLFGSMGIPASIGTEKGLAAFDALCYLVYPWFMVLLFLVAGMCARYALQGQTGGQFLRSRAVKLLLPSTAGLFVYQWITGYIYITMSGSMQSIPAFLRYPICAVSGTGPLWFIQSLFLFSALLVLLRRIDRADRLWRFCGRANTAALLLLVLPVWGAAQILNVPVLTTYRFGIYGLSFFLGYFVFSHDGVQERLEKLRFPMLLAAAVLGALFVYRYFGGDYTAPQCLQSGLTNLYLWAAVLAVLGCGKAWLNRDGKLSAYMTRVSFGLYVLHYPIVLAVCCLLYYKWTFPLLLNYILALAAEFLLTILLWEIVKRIPVLRCLVLGIRKKKPVEPEKER